MNFAFIALFLFAVPNGITSWQSFEPDLFDLVEEVGKNFYDFFEISQVSDNFSRYFEGFE